MGDGVEGGGQAGQAAAGPSRETTYRHAVAGLAAPSLRKPAPPPARAGALELARHCAAARGGRGTRR